MINKSTNQAVLNKFMQLYEELLEHAGYGEIRVEMKGHRSGRKEVTLHCGKQHKFVVDYKEHAKPGHGLLVVRRKMGQKELPTPAYAERRVLDRRLGASPVRSFKLDRRVSIDRRIRKKF